MKTKKIFSLEFSIFLIWILLIGFAQAAPFANIVVDKNESSFAAGNTQQIAVVSFDNTESSNQSLAVELNITSNSPAYPVEKEDFSVYGLFNSTRGGVTNQYVLKCFERYNGSFWCYNMTETNRIVLHNSNNKVSIYTTSKVNLYPTGYNITLVLYSEVGMPKVEKPTTTNFTANETKTVDTKNETNSTLDIFAEQNIADGSINITTYDTPTVQTAFGVTELNKYLSIEASQEIKGNISWVILKIYYTDAEVAAAGLDESTLRIHYYNATNDSWEKYDTPRGGVDTNNNYVWANATHFSLWGLFGNTPSAPSTPAAAGGGGGGCFAEWTCSDWGACTEGMQTRTCTNSKSYCTIGAKPIELQGCTAPTAPVAPTVPTPAVTPIVTAPTGAAISETIANLTKVTGKSIFNIAKESYNFAKGNRKITFSIVIAAIILVFLVSTPFTAKGHYRKAEKLHKKAEAYYNKGNFARANALFNKAQIYREKGESKSGF